VPALWTVSAARREALGLLEREVAAAVEEQGPSTGPQLRALVGADKKAVDKAVVSLQRALVVTNAALVEQRQGWGAIAVDRIERLWPVEEVADAERDLVCCVLASSGEVSAADVAGALGWRAKPARVLLDRLVDERVAVRRDEDGLALYRSI